MAPKHADHDDPVPHAPDEPGEAKARKEKKPKKAKKLEPAIAPPAVPPVVQPTAQSIVQSIVQAGHAHPPDAAEKHHPAEATPPAATPSFAKPEARKLPPQIVENLHAPEYFATDAQSISLINGMISIAFASSRYDYAETPSVLKNVVVGRIVMSPVGAQNLAVRLFNFLEQKGFAAVPKDPKQRQ